MAKKYSLLLILIFSIGLGLTPLQAQLTDTAKVPEPTAISIIDLNAKIELVTQRLKNIDKKSAVPSQMIEIDTLLPGYKEILAKQTKEYFNFKKSHPNRQKVLNIINKWGSYKAHLGNWQNLINGFLNNNTTILDELNLLDKQWLLTYQNIKKENSPYEVTQLVSETRATIKKLIRKLNEQNHLFLSLETKTLILNERITAVLDDLEMWKKSEEFSVLNRRHLPVWKIHKEEKQSTDKFDAWDSFKENVRGVYLFIISPENNVVVYLTSLFFMIILFWRLKRSFKNVQIGEKDNRLIQSKNVIVTNLWASITFTVVIISILYFTHTPNLLNEILLIMAMVSTMPFIKPIAHKKFKGLIYFVVLLYILNTLKSYIWYSSNFYRLYIFIEAALALFVIYKMTHPYLKTRRLALKPLSILAVRLTPILYFIFSVSIVANVLGYTNLTDFLLKVGILGSVLGMMLFGMLVILHGFADGVTHFYFSKLEKFEFKNKVLVEKRADQFITLFAYIFISIYFLHVVDVYEYLVDWLIEFMAEPVQKDVTFTWGGIFSFLVVLIISFGITSFISTMIEGGVLNFLKLPKGIPAIISVILRYFIIALAFIIALSALGVDLSKFNIMAGALGLGIGFGLQNIISNFISGLILIFERPIQAHDVVEVGSLLGEVKKIGVRSSNIRTFNGAEVVVPNSNLISNEVINWTLSDNIKRIEIKIGAAYGTDLQKVVNILHEVAVAEKNVLKKPEPMALFSEFGDSSLDFRLLYWIPVEFGIKSKSDISIAIYNRFTKDGITIPFPQRDVNFKKEDIEALKGEK